MLNLMKTQDDATERHKKLIVEHQPRLDTVRPEDTWIVHSSCPTGHSNVGPQSEPAVHSQSTPLSKPMSNEPYFSYEEVLRALTTCACVASQLAVSVNKASMDWAVSQEMDARHSGSYGDTGPTDAEAHCTRQTEASFNPPAHRTYAKSAIKLADSCAAEHQTHHGPSAVSRSISPFIRVPLCNIYVIKFSAVAARVPT